MLVERALSSNAEDRKQQSSETGGCCGEDFAISSHRANPWFISLLREVMIVSHVASPIQMVRLFPGAKDASPAPHAHSPSVGTQTTQLHFPSGTCRPRTTLRYERQAIESRSVGRAVVARMVRLRANLVAARASWEEKETTTSHNNIVTAAASCALVNLLQDLLPGYQFTHLNPPTRGAR